MVGVGRWGGLCMRAEQGWLMLGLERLTRGGYVAAGGATRELTSLSHRLVPRREDGLGGLHVREHLVDMRHRDRRRHGEPTDPVLLSDPPGGEFEHSALVLLAVGALSALRRELRADEVDHLRAVMFTIKVSTEWITRGGSGLSAHMYRESLEWSSREVGHLLPEKLRDANAEAEAPFRSAQPAVGAFDPESAELNREDLRWIGPIRIARMARKYTSKICAEMCATIRAEMCARSPGAQM